MLIEGVLLDAQSDGDFSRSGCPGSKTASRIGAGDILYIYIYILVLACPVDYATLAGNGECAIFPVT